METIMKLIKEVIIPVITVLTGLMVAYLNNSVSRVESKLEESKEQRMERESIQNYDLKIYDKVVESLETQNAQRQQVAKALVIVMASEDLRENLLSVLEQAGTDTVRRQVAKIIEKEKEFKTEEKAVETLVQTSASGSSDWRNYNYDIFWCEKSGKNAEAFAEKVVATLKQNGAKGRLRVRPLPETVNSRQGYQISGYVIRANQNELPFAKHLAQQGQQVVGDEFVLTFSTQPTPLYLSAFICP